MSLLALLLLQAVHGWSAPGSSGRLPLSRSTGLPSRRRFQLRLVPGAGNAAIEGLSEAFIGGTVGVMSVAFILEVQRSKELSVEVCPYCMGGGQLLCGVCLGAARGKTGACSCCSGAGLVLCINCKGDGRATPIMLQSKAVRSPEFSSPDAPSAIDSP